MSELVFEHKPREYHGPARAAETEFTHLDRSACRHSEIARGAVNRWFKEFAGACNSLGKIKSSRSYLRDAKKINRFSEALLELVTLQLLSATGYEVDIEPTFDEHGGRSPDYLLRVGGLDFLVECNVRRGQENPTTSQAVQQLWDWVNENVNTHGYHLFITKVTYGAENPSRRNLKRALEQKAEQLSSLGEEAYYGFEYTDDSGFELELSMHRANPLKEEHVSHSRAIGMYPTVFTWGNGSGLLEDAVSGKAHRYRDLQKPLVVVLGSGGVHEYHDAASLLHGMFGRNVYDELGSMHISLLAADMNRTGEDRRAKAAFGFLTEPRNRNISAVLYKPDFGLWSMGKDNWLVLHNPFTMKGYELPKGLFPFSHEISFDSKFQANVTAAGKTVLDILELPEGWPTSVECECGPYSRAELDAATNRLLNDFLGDGTESR